MFVFVTVKAGTDTDVRIHTGRNPLRHAVAAMTSVDSGSTGHKKEAEERTLKLVVGVFKSGEEQFASFIRQRGRGLSFRIWLIVILTRYFVRSGCRLALFTDDEEWILRHFKSHETKRKGESIKRYEPSFSIEVVSPSYSVSKGQ